MNIVDQMVNKIDKKILRETKSVIWSGIISFEKDLARNGVALTSEQKLEINKQKAAESEMALSRD